MKNISFRTLRSMCLDLIIFLIPLSLAFLAFPHIMKITAPFLCGLFLYFTANPLNRILKSRKIPKTLCALISLLIISLTVFVILRFVGEKIFTELYSLTENPPDFYTTAFTKASRRIDTIASGFNLGNIAFPAKFISSLTDALKSIIADLVSGVSRFLINFAKGIPSLLVASFATIFTAFFLLRDSEKIFAFLRAFFGEKFCHGCLKLKKTFFSVAASYFKAQLLIEGIVFAVLLAGFLIMKVRYAFLLSILAAIVDAVPVFGTGTVLIPMSLFGFFSGDASFGWGILILYGITLLVRQLCEPKILGSSLGIHPLLTVFSLYAGMKLFGIVGLILGPFIAIFAKFLLFSE